MLFTRIPTLRRLAKNQLALVALVVVLGYALIAVLAYTNVIGSSWDQAIGGSYEPPSSQHWFGTDIFGRSVAAKVIKSTESAMSVGFVVSTLAIFIGVTLGAVSGYFRGITDELITWLYSTLAAIPDIILLIALAFVLGKGILSVYIALGITSWLGLYRLIRGEVIRHKNREYIQAATAIGASNARKLLFHIIPNTFHIVIIEFSSIFQSAIKSEVILSYLGLGVQNRPSWGIMINDAKVELVRGVWWQLTFATLAMFLIILALNILSDALRDVLDPKLKGQ